MRRIQAFAMSGLDTQTPQIQISYDDDTTETVEATGNEPPCGWLPLIDILKTLTANGVIRAVTFVTE